MSEWHSIKSSFRPKRFQYCALKCYKNKVLLGWWNDHHKAFYYMGKKRNYVNSFFPIPDLFEDGNTESRGTAKLHQMKPTKILVPIPIKEFIIPKSGKNIQTFSIMTSRGSVCQVFDFDMPLYTNEDCYVLVEQSRIVLKEEELEAYVIAFARVRDFYMSKGHSSDSAYRTWVMEQEKKTTKQDEQQ